jgi:hypothetical protein
MPLPAIGQCISRPAIAAMPKRPERSARRAVWGARDESSQVRESSALGLEGSRPLGTTSPVALLFLRTSATPRGHTKQAVLARSKSCLLQHAWHCLIYSGVYLFQFLRHMVLLLKTSSALPAHHCIRQASRRHGWLPRAFLPFPSPVRTAR